jgi:hypothetical protein
MSAENLEFLRGNCRERNVGSSIQKGWDAAIEEVVAVLRGEQEIGGGKIMGEAWLGDLIERHYGHRL